MASTNSIRSINDLQEYAFSILEPVLDRSGHVLYSNAASLRKGPVYLLGHNPGGSSEDQAENTIRASLSALPDKKLNNYVDEAWKTASGRSWSKGSAPLQRRVVWLLRELGFQPRDVPASNLIFARSEDVAGSSFGQLADLCWQVHEAILRIVQPRLLLVFGNSQPSPYSFLRQKYGMSDEVTFESGHGSWQCRAFRTKAGMVVVGLPHLSRYNIIGKSAVITWIRGVGRLQTT